MKCFGKSAFLIMLAAIACSCGPQVVPSSGPRPPGSADQVTIYPSKPHRYEELGLLSLPITPDLAWDQNGDANKAFDTLKEKAAEMGANGLLLDVDAGRDSILTQAGYHGQFYVVPMKDHVAYSEAIYVLKE